MSEYNVVDPYGRVITVKPHFHDGKLVSNIEYLVNKKGSVQVAFCETCGEVTSIRCEHKKNTWLGEEGNQKLICDLCGKDGT